MITVFIVFMMLVLIGIVAGICLFLAALSPILAAIVLLPLLDIIVFKLIRRKK